MITQHQTATCDECRNIIPVADAEALWPCRVSVAHWRREIRIDRADPCTATVDLDLCRECRGRITLTEFLAICERRALGDLRRQEELARAAVQTRALATIEREAAHQAAEPAGFAFGGKVNSIPAERKRAARTRPKKKQARPRRKGSV